MTQFLFNAWYAAAWHNEVSEQFLTRTLLDIPILFFRERGKVIAMHDRCPHRFAPLSRGIQVEGNVRCGYHGLTFDSKGNCVKSLFSAVAPKAAKVRTFATHEQDKLIWVWMGDLPPTAVETIPRLSFHNDEEMRCNFGYTHANADYRLLSDNLMDLTHTAMLHPSFGGVDYIPTFKHWEENGDIISQYIVEHMPSFLEPGGPLIHNQDKIRWIAPATHYLESHVAPEDGSHPTLFIPSAHILTPETLTTSHYFWSSATPAGVATTVEMMRAVLVQAFDHEDKPMLEAVQRRMGNADLWDLNPVLLPTDVGAVRVRRRLAELIDAEQQHGRAATGARAEV